jgi:hypothetical protein
MDVRPHDLHYAATPPWHGQRRWRAVLWTVAVLAMLFAGITWAPLGIHRLKTAYWTQQCLDYALPPDHIVVEESVMEDLRIFERPDAMDRLGADQFRSTSRWPVVFLHGRVSPSGVTRLVCAKSGGIGEAGFDMECDVFAPGTGGMEPRYLRSTTSWIAATMHKGSVFRIFAGQPDSVDPNHFMFDFEIDGTRSTVDGWLRNDETVLLAVRQAATRQGTQPAATR